MGGGGKAISEEVTAEQVRGTAFQAVGERKVRGGVGIVGGLLLCLYLKYSPETMECQ